MHSPREAYLFVSETIGSYRLSVGVCGDHGVRPFGMDGIVLALVQGTQESPNGQRHTENELNGVSREGEASESRPAWLRMHRNRWEAE